MITAEFIPKYKGYDINASALFFDLLFYDSCMDFTHTHTHSQHTQTKKKTIKPFHWHFVEKSFNMLSEGVCFRKISTYVTKYVYVLQCASNYIFISKCVCVCVRMRFKKLQFMLGNTSNGIYCSTYIQELCRVNIHC